jgi:hypothetical protein
VLQQPNNFGGNLTFQPCDDEETAGDYALHLNSLAAHLTTLGTVAIKTRSARSPSRQKETQIVEKMLHGLLSQFKLVDHHRHQDTI